MTDDNSEQTTLKATIVPLTDEDIAKVWPVGALIDGRYRVLEVNGGPGRSGMGVVYIVESDEGRLAVKTFQHHFSRNLTLIQRFMREARTWLLIGFHPNIVRAVTVDILDATPYLFMEYVEPDDRKGLSLADRLSRGPIAMRKAVLFAIQCCDGMIHASAAVPGLVHRDLKPENLLITRDGTLKISDFGLVRCRINEKLELPVVEQAHQSETITQYGSALGTPAYMAPEQFVAAGDVTPLADLYAFGCCFYEALSGQRLFTIHAGTPVEHLVRAKQLHLSEPPVPLRERVPGCPRELDEAIMRCLEKDPARRWPDFQELRARLVQVLEHDFGTTYVPPPMPDPSPEDIAAQMEALSALDGYGHAISMRHLRENQDKSPYAFHLALASYFRSHDEQDQERRHLVRATAAAARSRGRGEAAKPESGYEAVRRLAELHLEAGEPQRAARLLEKFLRDRPDALELVLEPHVTLLIEQGEFKKAEAVVRERSTGLRADLLLAKLYRASGQRGQLAELSGRRIEAGLEGIRQDIAGLRPGDRVGWEYDTDCEALRTVLARAAPDIDTSILGSVEHAVWPDLSGSPDFSGDMAWLSQAYGELAELDEEAPNEERTAYAEYASLMGYPERLERHLRRDEDWMWLESSGNHPA